jgi:hypothetical protein
VEGQGHHRRAIKGHCAMWKSMEQMLWEQRLRSGAREFTSPFSCFREEYLGLGQMENRADKRRAKCRTWRVVTASRTSVKAKQGWGTAEEGIVRQHTRLDTH